MMLWRLEKFNHPSECNEHNFDVVCCALLVVKSAVRILHMDNVPWLSSVLSTEYKVVNSSAPVEDRDMDAHCRWLSDTVEVSND